MITSGFNVSSYSAEAYFLFLLFKVQFILVWISHMVYRTYGAAE
jgi:hypothetical protein